ncbi:hypothetical protein Tco_1468482 [Tanacetum coccineum]
MRDRMGTPTQYMICWFDMIGLNCMLACIQQDEVDSREEGAESEVTGFEKAFDLPTLGITVDLRKGVTEYSFGSEEEGGFPKIDCLQN